jgi:hypothetical protein
MTNNQENSLGDSNEKLLLAGKQYSLMRISDG